MAGQHAHHGQHRIAPAHASGMIQLRRADAVGEIRQRALVRLGDDGEMLLERFDARLLQRVRRRQHLHQGFGGAAGFGDGDEMRLLEIEALQRRCPRRRDRDCRGIPHKGLVHFAQRGQRLAAQAGAADAQHRHGLHALDARRPALAAAFRSSVRVGMPRSSSALALLLAQPVQRAVRSGQRLRRNRRRAIAPLPDKARSRETAEGDSFEFGHGSTLAEGFPGNGPAPARDQQMRSGPGLALPAS